MPLRRYRCIICGKTLETKGMPPICCDLPMEPTLDVPATKFMEPTDKEAGKSQMKDQQKILLERARSHSRDVEMHDLIQMNPEEVSKQNRWLKEDGTKRKAIDDK